MAEPDAVVFELEHEDVPSGGHRILAFPPVALDVHEVVDKHRLAFEQVEAVAAEPAAVGHEHPLCASLRDFDLGGDLVGPVEGARGVSFGCIAELAGITEFGAAAGQRSVAAP